MNNEVRKNLNEEADAGSHRGRTRQAGPVPLVRRSSATHNAAGQAFASGREIM
jgi:hypothetical protein